ncbi:MAG: hypothetical protein NTW86_32955 [Candidatus Sumerlaeota bacterium]|nr:hypothetical protein [Candidatus Sumerlaeota bacterium]
MELWLTPLTYRDIAGIEVGRALYWHSRHAVPECILNLAVLSVAAGIFARFGWAPQHPLVRIVCYGGLLAGFIALNLETRSAVVKKVLHAVRRAVVGSAGDIQTKRRFDRWIGRGAASVSGALFVLLATCFLGFLIALCFSNTPSGDGPYILVGFGGFIVAAICAGAVWWDEMRFEVNVADDEWAKDGQKRYEDLVRELAEEHSSAAV